MSATSVYYNVSERMQSRSKRFTPYDLSDAPTLTPDDRWIIVRCIERLLDLMDECVAVAREYPELKKQIVCLDKERIRVRRLLPPVLPWVREIMWEWRRVAAESAHHPLRKRARGDFEINYDATADSI